MVPSELMYSYLLSVHSPIYSIHLSHFSTHCYPPVSFPTAVLESREFLHLCTNMIQASMKTQVCSQRLHDFKAKILDVTTSCDRPMHSKKPSLEVFHFVNYRFYCRQENSTTLQVQWWFHHRLKSICTQFPQQLQVTVLAQKPTMSHFIIFFYIYFFCFFVFCCTICAAFHLVGLIGLHFQYTQTGFCSTDEGKTSVSVAWARLRPPPSSNLQDPHWVFWRHANKKLAVFLIFFVKKQKIHMFRKTRFSPRFVGTSAWRVASWKRPQPHASMPSRW